MSEQSITKTVKSILSSDTDLNQKVRSNNWVTIGLAATGALLVTLSVTTRHKFQYAQVCISANCDDDQKGYLLIQSVYDSERAINPNSFGRKTEQIGYIPGAGWILYLEAILGTSLMGAAYSYHSGFTKTLLGNLVLDKLPGDSVVWTIKRKPHQWQGRAVIGVPEDFERLEIEFQKLQAERKERLSDVEAGLEPDIINVAIDEWRAIKNRIDCAVDVVRDTLTLAREARQRLLLFAQGRQVKTFGLTDESDLEECMVSIYMGAFAREEAEAYYSKAKHIEEDSKTKVIAELEKAGSRALWIHSGFGNYPGLAPTIEI